MTSTTQTFESTGTPTTVARRRIRRPLQAIALTGALLGLAGAPAFAEEPAPVDPTSPTTPAPPAGDPATAPVAAPSSFLLPLFGTGLVVDVETGPGGNLTKVSVFTPGESTAPAGLTATEVSARSVEIVNEDGSAKVVVRSDKGGQRVEARAGSLEEISGPGGWSGEIFPGVPASVAFEVTGTDGTLGLVLGRIDGPVSKVGTPELESEDGEQEISVKIEFRQDGMRRTMKIQASVETDDDGDGGTEAKVRISLSKIKEEPFKPFKPVEPDTTVTPGDPGTGSATKTWSGKLCTGEKVSITYTVAADGTISVGAVSPGGEQWSEGNWVKVRFASGEWVKVKVKNADGKLAVRIEEGLNCKGAPAPTVNVPVAPDKDDDDDKDHDKDHDEDHGDDDEDGDDSTTTTAATTPSGDGT